MRGSDIRGTVVSERDVAMRKEAQRRGKKKHIYLKESEMKVKNVKNRKNKTRIEGRDSAGPKRREMCSWK